LESAHRWGLTLLTPHNPLWPQQFGDLGPHQPLAVWVAGDPGVVTNTATWLAVVGSRRASPAGVAATRAVVTAVGGVEDSPRAGIISGGAHGIDVAAHRAGLDASLPSLAVLAGGLDSLYPVAHHGIFTEIVHKGALLSESPCGRRPRAEMFLHRNRLIAALARAVVVVEAAHRSGAINTASHAATLGREIRVVPGRWSDPLSQGCLRLVREGTATVLTTPHEVGELLGWHLISPV
jgi:DNA processing protein